MTPERTSSLNTTSLKNASILVVDDEVGMQAVLKKAVERSGITGDVAPHDLRRTFGTTLSELGHDINEVQQAMGHADPSTTQRYILSKAKLRDMVQSVEDRFFAAVS